MCKPHFLFAFSLLISLPASGQSATLSDWTKLIDNHKCEEAKTLCEAFIDSADTSQRAESQKCLANVSLCGHDVVQLEGDDVGGGTLRGGFTPDAVDEALVHLNLGIKVAPQDLSIHQGRLHILEASGRYSDMVNALDESCTIYRGSDALDAWLAYAPELADLGHYQDALAFMKVLDKHYPGSPDVVGNIGAFLSLLNRPAEAIPYLQQATQLAPKDATNAWDLGRAYDYDGQTHLADTWYRKGLALQTDAKQRSESSCTYAKFIEQKLHDRKRACQLQKNNCAADERSACRVSSEQTNKSSE